MVDAAAGNFGPIRFHGQGPGIIILGKWARRMLSRAAAPAASRQLESSWWPTVGIISAYRRCW